MRVKEMDGIGEQMSVIADDVQWTPETSHLFRKTPPSVYPGFFDQRGEAQAVLRQMPVFQAVVARVNQVLARTGAIRETVERGLRE